MPFGPKYVAIELLEAQAKSIRPALKRIKAMERREELDAQGRIKSLEVVKVELAEQQAQVDAEITKLLEQVPLGEKEPWIRSSSTGFGQRGFKTSTQRITMPPPRNEPMGIERRTMRNLAYIDKAHKDPHTRDQVHVVTQIMNSLLGLVILPSERGSAL